MLDDYSNHLWTSSSSHKTQIYSNLGNLPDTQFEQEITSIQCDNDCKFDDGPFREFCKSSGLSLRLYFPFTSSQNGKLKHKIRTINNIVRTLCGHASLPPNFVHHTLQMTTCLLNILPSKI